MNSLIPATTFILYSCSSGALAVGLVLMCLTAKSLIVPVRLAIAFGVLVAWALWGYEILKA